MRTRTGKSNIDIVKSYLSGERPFVTMGFTPDMIVRVEGETWKDADGSTWTFKNGQKKRISKISEIVGSYRMECKDCKINIRLLGKKLDRTMYAKTGRCMDCQIKFEDKLKVEGKFKQYEQHKIFSNQKSYCLDVKQKLEESISYLKDSNSKLEYFNADGSKETWSDTMRTRLLESAEKDYAECLDVLSKINAQLKEINYVE